MTLGNSEIQCNIKYKEPIDWTNNCHQRIMYTCKLAIKNINFTKTMSNETSILVSVEHQRKFYVSKVCIIKYTLIRPAQILATKNRIIILAKQNRILISAKRNRILILSEQNRIYFNFGQTQQNFNFGLTKSNFDIG